MLSNDILDRRVALTAELGHVEIDYVGIFPKGFVSFLVGEPGCGKTWFMLDIARSVADGVRGLGIPEPRRYYMKGRSVIFAGETGVSILADRLNSLRGGCQFLTDLGVFSSMDLLNRNIEIMLDKPAGLSNLCRVIEGYRPSIVFFDTLISFLGNGKDESNQADMTEVVRNLSVIADKYKVAIVLVHHFRKTQRGPGRPSKDQNDVIGSSTFIRLASVIVSIEKREGGGKLVRCLKSWWREFQPFQFWLEDVMCDDGKTRIDIRVDYGLDFQNRKSTVPAYQRCAEEVLRLFKDFENFTAEDVADRTGYGITTARSALRNLASSNVVVSEDVKEGRASRRYYRLLTGAHAQGIIDFRGE